MKTNLKYILAITAVMILCGCRSKKRTYPKYDKVATGHGWFVYQINDTTLLYVSNYSTQPPQIEYIKKGE